MRPPPCFISPFFRPPGAADPQKGRRHIRNQSTPACKNWHVLARGLLRNRWPNKQTNKHTVKQIPRPSLYERMAGNKQMSVIRNSYSLINTFVHKFLSSCVFLQRLNIFGNNPIYALQQYGSAIPREWCKTADGLIPNSSALTTHDWVSYLRLPRVG